MEWFNNLSRGAKIGISVAALFIVSSCCLLFGGYVYVNGVRTEGLTKEVALSAQYLDNQNELSSYISGFYEQVGIAQAGTAALDQILTDAVKGRYDKDGFGSGSPLFTAIAEAYPDTTALMNNWGKIQDYITAGREAYKAKQSKLLDMLRAYDTWRLSDFIRSAVVRALGFPSSEGLKARIGENIFSGQSALDKMYAIVLTQDALDAYNSGTMNPLQVPGTATQTP
jgi:hypothetical protein